MEYFDYLPILDEEEKKKLIYHNEPEGNLERLVNISKYKLTLLENIKLGKEVEKNNDVINKSSKYQKVSLGIMGNFTFSHLKYSMMAAAFRRRILLDIEFAPYDSVYPIALGKIQPFNKKMDYMLIYMSPESYYSSGTSIGDTIKEIRLLIKNIQQKYDATIILTNWYKRSYDNTSSINVLNENSFDAFVEEYNYFIKEISKSDDTVLLFNLNKISSFVGLNRWYKPEDYYRNKVPFALQNSDFFSDYFARFLGSYLRIRKKIIVLDLDGVLWGGLVSDNNIKMGSGTGEGEDRKSVV